MLTCCERRKIKISRRELGEGVEIGNDLAAGEPDSTIFEAVNLFGRSLSLVVREL